MIRKNAGFALLEGMTAYNEAVARDPMNARNEFLKESACRRPRAVEARVRLFFLDRLPNRVQDEQELIRRRDAAEHAHTMQNLEFPVRHLVTY